RAAVRDMLACVEKLVVRLGWHGRDEALQLDIFRLEALFDQRVIGQHDPAMPKARIALVWTKRVLEGPLPDHRTNAAGRAAAFGRILVDRVCLHELSNSDDLPRRAVGHRSLPRIEEYQRLFGFKQGVKTIEQRALVIALL